MNKKRKGIILSILGIIGLTVITAGVTYAFFNYVKQGTTENTITTGTITFLYTEVEASGAGISIIDALPMSDEQGKAQTGAGNVFNFKVQANTMQQSAINYEVTARKKDISTLDEEAVKLYLTEVNGDTETEILLDNYSNLTQTSVSVPAGTIEKTIYTGKVPSDTQGYEKNFRLRLWLDDSIDFSPVKDEEGNDTYPYNGKTFTVTVNVYANAKVITTEEVAFENNTGIKTVLANETTLEESTDGDYDYMTTFANDVTSVELAIEPENEDATVEVTKVEETVALSDTNIKRLSSKKTFTFDLEEKDNLFKVVVTSANKKTSSEYIINIYREPLCPYDVGQTWTYDYTGDVQTFTTPCSGVYKLETYGAGSTGTITGDYYASDGRWNSSSPSSTIGTTYSIYGSYATGTLSLSKSDDLYVYCGKSNDSTGWQGSNKGGSKVTVTITWEGKTISQSSDASSYWSSGATDIRVIKSSASDGWSGDDSLKSRIVTAGGGSGLYQNAHCRADYNSNTKTYTRYVYDALLTQKESSNSVLGQGSAGYSTRSSGTYNDGNYHEFNWQTYGAGGGGYYGGTVNCNGTSLVQSYNDELNGKTYELTDASTKIGTNNGNGKAQITLISID